MPSASFSSVGTPILIPAEHGDLASLLRAAEAAARRGIGAILDPILDPIHFGFMDSLARYAELRIDPDEVSSTWAARMRTAGSPQVVTNPSSTPNAASIHFCGIAPSASPIARP